MEEWGPWVKHDGTHIPGPVGTPIVVRYADGDVEAGTIGDAGVWPPRSWLWATPAGDGAVPILSYRMRRGIEDGLEVCRRIVCEVEDHPPEPVAVPSPAGDGCW